MYYFKVVSVHGVPMVELYRLRTKRRWWQRTYQFIDRTVVSSLYDSPAEQAHYLMLRHQEWLSNNNANKIMFEKYGNYTEL
jgi:hypothetical protein